MVEHHDPSEPIDSVRLLHHGPHSRRVDDGYVRTAVPAPDLMHGDARYAPWSDVPSAGREVHRGLTLLRVALASRRASTGRASDRLREGVTDVGRVPTDVGSVLHPLPCIVARRRSLLTTYWRRSGLDVRALVGDVGCVVGSHVRTGGQVRCRCQPYSSSPLLLWSLPCGSGCTPSGAIALRRDRSNAPGGGAMTPDPDSSTLDVGPVHREVQS